MKYSKYSSYKDSGVEWLGEIPSEWVANKIKNICYINDGNHGEEYPSEKDYTDARNGIPFIRAGNIQKLEINSTDMLYITKEKNSSMRKGNLQYLDILFTNRGEIGKVAIIKKEFIGSNLNSQIAYVRADNKKIDAKYLAYSLISDVVKYMKDSLSAGSVLTQFPIKDLSNIPVMYPPIQEQQAIANYLDIATDKIDTLISKQTKLIELLKEKRQALISHTVTKGLNPHAKMKQSGVEWLGEIPEDWGYKNVKYLLNNQVGIKIGPFGSALKLDDMTKTGYKVYGQENVIKSDFSAGHRFISETKYKEMIVYKIEPNDILITMMGTIGKCIVIPEEYQIGIIDSHLIKIRTNELMLPDYFVMMIDKSDIVKTQLQLNSKGSIMQGLNSSIIKSLLFPLPSVTEQKKILSYLDDKTKKIDTLIQKATKAITLLKERRTALISSAVTGKIDVRNMA